MRRVWLVLPIAFVLLAASSKPPMPSKLVTRLQSPKAAETFVGKTSSGLFTAPPASTWMLAWNYATNAVPGWTTNIAFELWHVIDLYSTNTAWMTNDTGQAFLMTNIVTNLTNWTVYASITGALSCTMSTTQTADMFKIRAVDTRSGEPSEWATK